MYRYMHTINVIKEANEFKEAIEFKMHISKMCQMYHGHLKLTRVFLLKIMRFSEITIILFRQE